MMLIAQTDFALSVFEQYGIVGGVIIIMALILMRIAWVQITILKDNAANESLRDKQYVDLVEMQKKNNKDLIEDNRRLRLELNNLRAKFNNLQSQFADLQEQHEDCIREVERLQRS